MPERPKLTVIGAGYLGITHAACMASLGFDVLAADVEPARVKSLSAGELPVFEPGLGEAAPRRAGQRPAGLHHVDGGGS